MADNTAQDPNVENQQAGSADPGQAPGADASGQSETVNWENRYKGVMAVLNQRNAEIERLKAEGLTSGTAIETLNTRIGTLQAEMDSKVAALTEQLKTITGERDQALTNNTGLNAYKVKMEALKEFPDLLPLASTIPDIPDAEMMKQHLQLLAKGVGDITSQKAKQLTAGMTPGAQTPASGQQQFAYSTLDDWQKALNGAAGGDEFSKLSGAFKQWLGKQ
jgi:uncharacterized small protein (DUF1192 family)